MIPLWPREIARKHLGFWYHGADVDTNVDADVKRIAGGVAVGNRVRISVAVLTKALLMRGFSGFLCGARALSLVLGSFPATARFVSLLT